MNTAINRRQFVKASLAATIAAKLRTPALAQGTTKPPNILYIFADQHRAVSVNGTSSEQAAIYTPNINALAQNGFTMGSCYTNYPLCSPHRAILQTGVFPQQNGVTGNGILNATSTQKQNVTDLNTANVAVAQILKSGASYYSGYIGKWDLFADPGHYLQPGNANRFGYDEWMVWYNNNDHWTGGGPNPASGTSITESNSSYTYNTGASNGKQFVFPYSTSPALGVWNPHCQTLQALDFISRNDGTENPWVLFLSYNVPHPPYDPPDGNPPSKASNGYHYYNESATPVLRSNADVGQTLGSKSGLPIPDASLNQVYSSSDLKSYQDPTQTGNSFLQSLSTTQSTYWNYYEGISDIDTEIGSVIAAVASDPNTIIIYTSDHGDLLGSHTLCDKQYPQEESSHVPFYVGGKINGTPIQGAYTGLFSSIDILPTLCGFAGVTVPSNLQGKSFAPVVTGQLTDLTNPNQYVFLLNGHGDPMNGNGDTTLDGYYAAPVYRGVRSSRYTYACVATTNLNWFQNTSPATEHTNVGPYAGGHWLLFDNQLDPYQMNNLIVNGVYPASTPSQPVPNWADISKALNGFITANGGGAYGNDAFASPVALMQLTPSPTGTVKLGQAVTIGVSLAPISTGPTPTGTISYSVDGGSAKTVAVTSGASSFMLSGLSELQHVVTVMYNGDSVYTAIPATVTLNGNVPQSILFPPLPNVTLASIQTVALSARTTSGEAVTYTVQGPATLNASSSTLTLNGTGTVSVTASAAANSSFAAATSVTQTFVVQ